MAEARWRAYYGGLCGAGRRAVLVHYSAGPYVAILALHYLIRIWPRRPNKWRELAWIAAICGMLVGTWLVWSLAVYGPQ